MSLSEERFSPLRQIGTYVLVSILSAVLTLSALWAFPNPLLSRLQAALPSIEAPAAVSSADQSDAAIAPQPISPKAEAIKTITRSFVASAVQRVGPAVVRIDTERTITANPGPVFSDPFFRDFFGDGSFYGQPKEYRQRGEGSGFVIDSNGIILTNAHVVSGADTVMVTLKDGRQLKGKVRGIDEPSDLAVVKVDGKNLPVAPLGRSTDLEVGDWAIALGNPLGLDNTVTLGIISTLNRSSAQIGIPDKRLDFIQTDAAINPGNSGGPLVNDRGEVIGINTAIRADAQGIGFAIPIDKAKAIKDVLAKGEKVQHPYVGVRMLSLTPELARQSNSDPNSPMTVPEIKGVLVVQVIPNSPAAKAGIRRGDVVTEVEGQAVTTAEQLQSAVERSKINQPLKFTLQRGEQTQELTVKPGELQSAAASE
ncbi:trypsin-like peptidase domain-containing protein [Kovacikia minuta CCNUW1]|uniref:HhoA/HhoB/HtrA family serine endopeptidase n=1 Tax=Kovacikia minuta TaxID=2931930 RepID=UPI001CD018BA|nr:HhoA/HhoB/HtrA family serine endopeptidase [Kovacikia minuta]UBF27011.1 trypsin-like peptidase domain-containing protein [Kovacikia minuta CCNUW1]